MNAYDYISSPVTSLQGEITIPGDKSISHRAIILGAIAEGKTTITGMSNGYDCKATIRAFKSMGVLIDQSNSNSTIIHGVGKYGLQKPALPIDCGNSGTSMRLLAGLLSAQKFDSTLIGDASLLKRPMTRICIPLLQMGANISSSNGMPPLVIRQNQTLHGIAYEMPEASAQVKSCILMAGLYADGETQVIEPIISRDHTERMLALFSYPIKTLNNVTRINAKNNLIGTNIHVPGDISSAAFFIVAATLIPNAYLRINNVGVNPTRTGILHVLKRMGADISLSNRRFYGEEPVADITVRHAKLHGITIPASIVPATIDEFPCLFIAAACAAGETLLHGACELRHKESDRIQGMVIGLNQLGIQAHALHDGVFIRGGSLNGGVIDSLNDHRIAMAFAIAGAVASSTVVIKNAQLVASSFPDFLDYADQLNLSIRVNHND